MNGMVCVFSSAAGIQDGFYLLSKRQAWVLEISELVFSLVIWDKRILIPLLSFSPLQQRSIREVKAIRSQPLVGLQVQCLRSVLK